MRTTVTLDPDVQAMLRTAMKERDLSFKEALNSAVRAGLNRTKQSKKPYSQITFSLGFEPNFPWEKALSIAAAMEDEEISRKLILRK